MFRQCLQLGCLPSDLLFQELALPIEITSAQHPFHVFLRFCIPSALLLHLSPASPLPRLRRYHALPFKLENCTENLLVLSCLDCKCLGLCTCTSPTTVRSFNRPREVVVRYRCEISDESEVHFLNKITKFKQRKI